MSTDDSSAHDGIDPEADEFDQGEEELESVGTETEADVEGVKDYDFKNVVLAPSDWTVQTILAQLDSGSFELDPDFQRRNAWSEQRKSKFIESLILGLPIPQIILAENDEDESGETEARYVVIDGKQRLLTLQAFFADSDSLSLSGLTVRKDLNGKTRADLAEDPVTSRLVKRLANQTIRTVVIRKWPSSDFLHLVFHRINHQTLALSAQELRQALTPGEFTRFADKRAGGSEELHKILGTTRKPDFRMRDVELLVRFIAYRTRLEEYRGNLKRFLDETCDYFNDNWVEQQGNLESLSDECEAAIAATEAIFKGDAFRRYVVSRYESRFNRAVFDVMAYYFSDPEIRGAAVSKASSIVEAYEELSRSDTEFSRALAATTKTVAATSYRLEAWGRRLARAIEFPIDVPSSDGKRIKIVRSDES